MSRFQWSVVVVSLSVALSACGARPVPPPAAGVVESVPTTSPSSHWIQSLIFSGEVVGSFTAAAPDLPDQRSSCTGRFSRRARSWALNLYGQLPDGRWGLVVRVPEGYSGPGTYSAPSLQVEMFDASRTRVWQALPGDGISFKVEVDEESGSLDGDLTNLANRSGQVHVHGTWTCAT